MKHIYFLLSFVLVSLLTVESAMAQQEVTVRELNTYDVMPESQADLADHPLVGEEVTFDAVVVAYPRNSGLATADDGESGAAPGRIHLFVTDVNAIDEGREGMSMQLVVAGAQQTTLEGLDRGDVVRLVGELTFFGSTGQFNASSADFLGNVELNSEYADLAPLLEPWEIDLTEVNQSVEGTDLHSWVQENYSDYVNSYVKFTGVEVLDNFIADQGRPNMLVSDGNTVIATRDASLRYRNDRGTYAFLTQDDGGTVDTVLSLDYNYRRLDESLDGPYTPPAAGSVVDISGFLVMDAYEFVPFDINSTERTFRIAPWEDGIRWTEDGTDTENRVTDGIPNDLVVQGFAPLLDQFTVTPDSGVASDDQVQVSVDVLLPEEDYTLNSVEIEYSSYAYSEESGDTTTATMTGSGDTYTFTFDSYEDFTVVDYMITATAETPDGVVTNARQEGSFQIESETQVAPVAFSPSASATYSNTVDVELSTATPNATIYYTTDGSDPTTDSDEYSSAITLQGTTTIKAIAVADGMDDSPINERTYNVEVDATETATLSTIRTGTQGDIYTYTGSAVVTYARPESGRNQIYLMDESGGLLIDDSDDVIASSYAIGDVMTEVSGELGGFGGISQLLPLSDPGAPATTADVTPASVTLADIDLAQHESMLVTVENVTFEETGAFEGSTDYTITDPSLEGETVIFRTNFGESDYIGEAIPEEAFTLTAIVGGYNGTLQLIARTSADLGLSVSNELDEMPEKFALEQNYPNPFNPTTVIQYSVADVSNVQLQVFDVLGRRVATLVNEVQAPGAYTVNFNARNLSSGTYFYRIEAGDFSSIKKMMLIK
ncbi:MAG: hypothetical protein CL666_00500 [Balneola sp.]|nr:hypothetical protein [Balneola sp.]